MSYKSTHDLLVAIRIIGNCLDFLEARLSDMHYAWNAVHPTDHFGNQKWLDDPIKIIRRQNLSDCLKQLDGNM